MTRLRIAQVNVTPVTLDVLHQYISTCIKSNLRLPILNVNAHAINLAQRDETFRAILNAAPVVFCDGFGVRLGARMLGHTTPPRITYADWMYQLAPFCAQQDFSLYLLGAQPGVAEHAAQNLLARVPGLKIAGTHHGFFAPYSGEEEAIIAQINAAKPDILIVAMGMPVQEKWIAAHLNKLDIHVALSGGACLDYVAGTTRRGPSLLVDHGFEWLARLFIDPQRLWRRYLLGNPLFLALIVQQWWRERWR